MTRTPCTKRVRGSSQTPLLLFLLFLLGAGGYNYNRNLQIEQREPRPYASYAESDLLSLRDAYEAEAQALEAQYSKARSRLGKAQRVGLIDENIDAFEAAQKRSNRARELGGEISMQRAATRQIEDELAKREGERSPLKLHLRRLTTI